MLSREKPLVKPMPPGSIFHIIKSHLHLASFRSTIFQSLLSNLYIKNTKNITLPFIYLYQISILQVTVKGLTTPLSRWVQVFDCLCRYSVTCVLSPTRLIPWFSKWGKYLRYFVASPFLFKGKTNASWRGSRKNFWRCCRGDLHQAKTYQAPIINSHLS